MREIRTSGSMSGERKRNDGRRPQVTAPLLDSTKGALCAVPTISNAKRKMVGTPSGARIRAARWLCPPYNYRRFV
jgi:hypothetical protein